MTQSPLPLDPTARILGLAGLLPQFFCVALLLAGPEYHWFALAGGFGYAAFIFCFLGGLWWGQALMAASAPRWIYFAAIAPSLIAFCTYMPWAFGWEWPGPSLGVLGLCLLASPLVDKRIADAIQVPVGWMQLRWILSTGLGIATLILALA